MNLSDEQKEKIWEELNEAVRIAHGGRAMGEKTIREFAEENNISYDTARKFLREQEEAGKLIGRYIVDNKVKKKVYSPANSS